MSVKNQACELSQAQYRYLFGSTDKETILSAVEAFNQVHPTNTIKKSFRRLSGRQELVIWPAHLPTYLQDDLDRASIQ